MPKVRFTRGQSLKAIKRLICKALVSFGVEESESEAESIIMIESVTGMRPSQHMMSERVTFTEEQLSRLDSILDSREKRIPIQYILGETYFMGLRLNIRPGVFIPRPDTETLVEVSVRKLKELFAEQNISMLEIGSGSGAIPVSLLHALKNLQAVSLDVSDIALSVSRENAVLHKVVDRLVLKQESEFWKIGERFNALISNPPYIPRHQESSLQPEVGLHEPHAALFGTDEDGLGFYRLICKHAHEVLTPTGFIAVEVGDDQGDAVRDLFIDAKFSDVEMHKDLNGLVRVVSAQYRA